MGAQNAIGGGGRYDKLAEEGGPSHAGSRLRARLRALRVGPEAAGVELRPRSATCSACVDDSVRPGLRAVQECRDAGFTTEMDHQKRSLKSQFKLADKLVRPAWPSSAPTS